jgi:sugar lactone lactonase YvrE
MLGEPIGYLGELGFPEALRWHKGELWFSDMFRGRVMAWVPPNPAREVIATKNGGPEMPGGLGWLPDGRVLVVDCLEKKVLCFNPIDKSIQLWANLSAFTNYPLNDLHVDFDGVAWVGGYGFNPDIGPIKPSPLYRITLDQNIEQTQEYFIFPNGSERSSSGLLVAETFADRLSILDDFGKVLLFRQLPEGSGPDGLTLGPNGSVIVALAFSGSLIICHADGTLDNLYNANSVQLDPKQISFGVYDCAFDPGTNILAVASASSDELHAEQFNTGSITLFKFESSE